MHRLLERQLLRCTGSLEVAPELRELIDSVDGAYREFDTDRAMLERSMELSSQELLHANAEIRAVLAAFPDLWIWLDGQGRVVNTKTGDRDDPYLSAGKLVGRHVSEFPTREVGRELEEALRQVRATGRPAMLEYELVVSGSASVYDARLFPLVGGQVLAIVRNITDTRRVELAEAAIREKSEFLANMSHELRTPLHGILSFARFGRKRIDGDREKLLDYFRMIERGGETLLALLNSLLDLAKLESGRVTFEFVPTRIGTLLGGEVDQLRSLLSERGIVLRQEPVSDDLTVELDPQKIRQVIRNVVGNAIKFSSRGETITVAVDAGEDTVRLIVSDQGPGIPEGEVDRIFDKFIQSSTTKTGAGGTGLGLSICREIVAAHEGRIWAENRAEGGARFTIELPRAARTAPTPAGAQ